MQNTYSIDDVSERLSLKQKLGCKSMQWYLDNVYTNSPFSKDYIHIGSVRD